jgi:pimeloyl-ACP methyl ester carboxylesterase
VLRAALAAVALAGFLAVPAGAQAPLFAKCPRGAAPRGAECGSIPVPLDRSGGVPGEIRLFMMKLAPIGGPPSGVLIPLAGGPGQAATPLAEDFLISLGRAVGGRQLVVFDQRGTGRSGVLRCPELERARGDDPRDYAACAEQIGPPRAFYTTRESVEDLEALRAALGVERISLYGVSYGTKVALAYAQRYPTHVDRLLLDSVVPLDGPEPFGLSTFAAVPRVLRELCAGGMCRGITPDPVADMQRLVASLRGRGPVRGPFYDRSGRRRSRAVARLNLFNALVEGDLDPTLRAELPGAVRSFLQRDRGPLIRLIRRAGALEENPSVAELSEALFAATICEETRFPWDRSAPADQRSAQIAQALSSVPDSAFLPFDRATAFASPVVRACSQWPTASAPPPEVPQQLPEVRTLVLAGRDDVRTPLEDAQSVAARIPGARLTAIPQSGHSVLSSDLTACADREIEAFFADQAARACPTRRRYFSPAPVAPLSLGDFPPAPGMRGNAGRTAAAIGFTIADATRQVIAAVIDATSPQLRSGRLAGGGLRGGSYILSSRGLELRRYEYLQGLRVTARLGGRPARLFVNGRYAVGTLLIHSSGLVTGRLSGQRVRYRISSGYRFPQARARTSLVRLAGPGDLRPPRPGAAGRGVGAGGIDVEPTR